MSDTENGIVDGLSDNEQAQMEAMRSEQPVEIEASESEELEAEGDDAPEAEQDDPQPERKKDGRVPLRKLVAEEERRRNAEKELADVRERFSRTDERLNVLNQLLSQRQQAQPEAPPDPQTDPIRSIEYTQQQMRQMQAQQEMQQRAYAEQQAIGQIDNAYKSEWQQFAGKQSDALDAYQHFVSAIEQNFSLFEPSPEAVARRIENFEREIFVAARQRGVSAAEHIYNMAKQFGYAPKADAKADDAAKKIAMREKAAGAAKSLSNAGGPKSNGALPSAEEIANMSDDEFMELRERIGERGFNRILGAG